MADLADITQDRAEREADLLQANSKKPSGPEANGSCHYCGENIPLPMRWCNADCRNGWQDEQALKSRK